jgi:predicted esterase
MTESYDQSKYPLDFWLWHGQNDPTVSFSTSELFEQWLIERGFDYTFVVTDGDHIDSIREPAFSAALQWFSTRFQEAGTAVEAKGKLASSWAAMKTR